MLRFLEFFAGGGMARAGLGPRWTCLFANDFDRKKATSYSANWGGDCLHVGDVAALKVEDLPRGRAELAWASFPCQDLSQAGAGAGLGGHRSGTFWPFWELVRKLAKQNRGPQLIVLENVCGALTSHGGQDFAAISTALVASGYRFGALVVDAVRFLPQSRPRLFFIAVASDLHIPQQLTSLLPIHPWHTERLIRAHNALTDENKANWIWWDLPDTAEAPSSLADLIEENPTSVQWHTPGETRRLLGMMSKVNRAKVAAARKTGKRLIGAIYRRTRKDEFGNKVQRAEIRFDVAGCLRTPSGGSSRQSILLVEGAKTRSRLLSSRETARLMGLPDTYILPEKYNDSYHLTGDGVAVPVVRHIAATLLEPILGRGEARALAA